MFAKTDPQIIPLSLVYERPLLLNEWVCSSHGENQYTQK